MSRYIKVKDTSCNNSTDIYNNYSGLWRYLKVDRIKRQGNKGYMLWTKTHKYRVEPSNVPTTT
jgi:hypothetical protein